MIVPWPVIVALTRRPSSSSTWDTVRTGWIYMGIQALDSFALVDVMVPEHGMDVHAGLAARVDRDVADERGNLHLRIDGDGW